MKSNGIDQSQTSIDEELFDVISGFEALTGLGRRAESS
jgi:hypothetical protein